ncbi:MAG: polysaccharide biosynthesis C-terminal domain-containing protein, partial [Clostridia bacterium]|nr:polysaccharide biosynthesis C-terminal domain-containing protein [Clostridia bacterium]
MRIRNGLRWLFEGRFWSAALRLAVPIALQNLLVCSFSLVDTIMVGQLGDVALSAVGMAGQWSWLMNMVLFGVASGASVYFAQYWGNRDERGIRRILGLVLLSGVVFSLAFALIAFLTPVSVIRIFNRTDVVVEAGSAYLRIAAFSYVAISLNTILCTALRSTERVRLPLLVSGISTVLNAVLNYGLIFGKFGLPEMGVAGAALATCISSWTAPV